MDEWESRLRNAAREIELYLEAHPNAADSLEGISTWWISRQRIRNELALVRAALEMLTENGVLTAGQINGKRGPIYRLVQKRN